MYRAFIASALALCAAACTRMDNESAGQAAAGCNASAAAPWRPLSGAEFTIEAVSFGPDCARAVATLVIRNAAGEVLWAEAHESRFVMTLAEVRDADAMQAALAEWIEPSNNAYATTAALPDWPLNSDAPAGGEFPFYPGPELPRDAYLALRARGTPVFCYVQGMESLACLALDDGAMTKIGVQTFPG
jgi:hypothetical protein